MVPQWESKRPIKTKERGNEGGRCISLSLSLSPSIYMPIIIYIWWQRLTPNLHNNYIVRATHGDHLTKMCSVSHSSPPFSGLISIWFYPTSPTLTSQFLVRNFFSFSFSKNKINVNQPIFSNYFRSFWLSYLK